MDICIPGYLRVFHHDQGRWQHLMGESFYNPPGEPPDLEFATRKYDISREKLVIELFRVNGGKSGYYLADLRRNKKYYYCGDKSEDVKQKLLEMGIGRVDPRSAV
jgi:hypothetical protein